MLEFEGEAGYIENSTEQQLRQQIKRLEEQLLKANNREKYTRQVNTILERKSVSDDLYRTLYLYLVEVLDIVNKDQNINVYPVKEYLENLLRGVRVEVYVGEAIYENLYTQTSQTTQDNEVEVMSLYNVATTDDSIVDLLGSVKMNSNSLVEISEVKLKASGFGDYLGGAIWVMEPLLSIVPGFTLILLKDRKFLTPIEREVITVYMKMVQHVLYSKILTRRLTEEVNQALEASQTDALTGINNRQKYHEDYLDNPNRRGEYVVFLDICKFKQVNDTHGHDIADKVLTTLGKELQKRAHPLGGEAYRLGGDEFLALLPASTPEYLVKQTIEAFRESWPSIPFTGLDGKTFHSKVSVGVCKNKDLVLTPKEAVQLADSLMYKSKKNTKEYPVMYNF